jgi:hypothetical protein
MVVITKWLSRNFQVALGMLWIVLSLSVFSLIGSMFGPQAPSHAEEFEVSIDQSASDRVATKPQQWTIFCERDDGTQGVFRILSNLTDEASLIDPVPFAQTGETSKEPSSQEMEDEIPETLDEDPFGNSMLHCERLLTLLALFGTEDTLTP